MEIFAVYTECFLTNQPVKEFGNSVYICQSYYQTSSGSLFETHGLLLTHNS